MHSILRRLFVATAHATQDRLGFFDDDECMHDDPGAAELTTRCLGGAETMMSWPQPANVVLSDAAWVQHVVFKPRGNLACPEGAGWTTQHVLVDADGIRPSSLVITPIKNGYPNDRSRLSRLDIFEDSVKGLKAAHQTHKKTESKTQPCSFKLEGYLFWNSCRSRRSKSRLLAATSLHLLMCAVVLHAST